MVKQSACAIHAGKGVTHVVKRYKVNMGESRLVKISNVSTGVIPAWSRGQ